MIKFVCSCGKNLKVADDSAGKKVKCPSCGQISDLPVPVAPLKPSAPAPTFPSSSPGTQGTETAALSGLDLSATGGEHPTDPASRALDPTIAQPGSPRQDTHVRQHDASPETAGAGHVWTLGGYRILRQLGQGGMGAVYEAEDVNLERHVALKVMKPEIAQNPVHRERFLREACVAASVENDFICPIYEVGEDQGVPFIAMPFLKGEPLSAHWKKGMRLPVNEVVRIGKEVAEGLSAAHEAGLIHRDIKPANIWLESQRGGPPRAVILDFGLARMQVDDMHMTQTGVIVGTPAFMSPEQGRGDRNVDARTDLFSLGCVLYALCTGKLPFKAETTMGILTALATYEPPPPAKISPTPRPLSGLIMRLLAKDPDDRPRTAQDLVKKLVEIERDLADPTETIGLEPPPRRSEESDRLHSRTQLLPPRTPPRKRSNALFPLIAIGLIGCLVALTAGGIYYVVTDKGTIEITTDDENVKVSLLKNGQEIEIFDGASKKTWSIRTGSYTVRLKDDPEGLEIVMPDTFEMKRGGKHVVTIRKLKGLLSNAPPFAVAPFDATQARKHQEAWAKYLGVPVEHTNSLGMKFSLIPAGKFKMGSTKEEIDRVSEMVGDNEGYIKARLPVEAPEHPVEITQPFYLGTTEVTVGHFRQFLKANPDYIVADDVKRNVDGEQMDDHPVSRVSWQNAVDFCNWLMAKERKKYRLPTEAEWEGCCRAGKSGTRYSFGDDDAQLENFAWYRGNSAIATHPVGQKKPNAWGLYDMHGNVWEWCQDFYDPGYYENSPVKDPPGGAGDTHVIRGGSLGDGPLACRCAFRYNHAAADVGFRVALTVDAVKQAPKTASLSKWGQVIDPRGDCRIVEDSGRLRITVPGGQTHDLNPLPKSNMNAPRILNEVEGNFEARVKVWPLLQENPEAELHYLGAGLVLWQDEGQVLLRHSRQLGNRPGIGTEWWTGTRLLGTDYLPGIKNGPVHLRLRRQGDMIHLAWSPDGQKWTEYGAAKNLKLSPRIRVGVSAVNGSFHDYTAEFEGFTILRETPAAAIAPFGAPRQKGTSKPGPGISACRSNTPIRSA